MEELNIVLRLLATSQIILFLIQILFSDNFFRVRAVSTILLLGCIGYLCVPLIQNHLPSVGYTVYLWLLPSIVPSMLLWFVWFVFEEHCHAPPWIIAITGISIGGSLVFTYLNISLDSTPWWFQVFKLFIVVLALYVVGRGHDQDLVEIRSKFRYLLIAILAGLIFVVWIIQVITHFEPPQNLESLIVGISFSLLLVFNYFFLRLNPNAQLLSPAEPVAAQDASNDPVIVQLLERMRAERLYADHDLRVAGLATLLNVPEYQLRRKINQQLGYRNFNQFVNRYRIEEAGVKLREDTRTPVLSIALDVGFRSISSFNTAFAEQFGVSPTKYRLEALSKD